MGIWRQVTESHSYARAKVQLRNYTRRTTQLDLARAELKDVVSDDLHAPGSGFGACFENSPVFSPFPSRPSASSAVKN